MWDRLVTFRCSRHSASWAIGSNFQCSWPERGSPAAHRCSGTTNLCAIPNPVWSIRTGFAESGCIRSISFILPDEFGAHRYAISNVAAGQPGIRFVYHYDPKTAFLRERRKASDRFLRSAVKRSAATDSILEVRSNDSDSISSMASRCTICPPCFPPRPAALSPGLRKSAHSFYPRRVRSISRSISSPSSELSD
jgi:hypothetical protein